MNRYLFLSIFLCVSMGDCLEPSKDTSDPNKPKSKKDEDIAPTGSDVSNKPKSKTPVIKLKHSDAFKTWFNALDKSPGAGKVSTAKAFIKKESRWLDPLNLPAKNVVIVNASNEDITFGGGGLNGALHRYVVAKESQKAWENLKLPDGTSSKGKKVYAGSYVISDISCGKIYHAVGPRAVETKDLNEAKKKGGDVVLSHAGQGS